MAKRHLLKFSKDLFEGYIGTEISNMEKRLNSLTRASMVDPGDVEEVVAKLRNVCSLVSNTSGLLTLAAKSPGEFKTAYSSIASLKTFLEKTISNVRSQFNPGEDLNQESQNLVDNCNSQLEKTLPLYKLYIEVETIRCWPSSKKNEKKWRRNNWGSINNQPDFLREIEVRITEIHTLVKELEENV